MAHYGARTDPSIFLQDLSANLGMSQFGLLQYRCIVRRMPTSILWCHGRENQGPNDVLVGLTQTDSRCHDESKILSDTKLLCSVCTRGMAGTVESFSCLPLSSVSSSMAYSYKYKQIPIPPLLGMGRWHLWSVFQRGNIPSTKDSYGMHSMAIHSVPVIWSSDIWSFRVYGQFLGCPNFAINYKIDHISRIWPEFRLYGQFLAGPTVDHISGTQCMLNRLEKTALLKETCALLFKIGCLCHMAISYHPPIGWQKKTRSPSSTSAHIC